MLNYSPFLSSIEEIQNAETILEEANAKRAELIKQRVASDKLVELKSDYLGMETYYYNKEKKQMYKVCNICVWSEDYEPNFILSYDRHILQLNSLD
jgi:hypothetical protein